MHLSVIDDDANVAGIASGQRTLLHALHDTFKDCRHEAGIDGSTHYRVDEDELAAPFQVDFLATLDVHLELLTAELIDRRLGHTLGIRLHDEVNLTKLACSTRLFLVTIVGTRHLGDGFAVWYARLLILHLYLFVVLKTPFQCAQMELALSVYDSLMKLLRLLHNPCRVFLAHLHERSHELLHLSLVHRTYGTRILRVRILDEVEALLHFLSVQSVARLHVFQLHGTANVAGIELVNRHTVGSCTSIDSTDALLRTAVGVRQVVARADASAHNLEVANLSDMWLHARLEEVNRLGTVAVGSNLLATGIVNLRHFADERHHIAQKFHQSSHAHVASCAHAEHGEDAPRDESLAYTFAHFVLGEALFLEELFHQSFVVLGCCLNKRGMKFLCLVHLLSRDVLDDGRAAFGLPRIFLHQKHVDKRVEAVAGLYRVLYLHALAAVNLAHIAHYDVEVAVVAVKLVNEEYHWLLKLLGITERILRANLRTILSVDKYHGLVGNVECGDCSANEVVASRTVNHVELLAVPLHMEHR